MPKYKKTWMLSHIPNEDEIEDMLWCNRNNIRVSPGALQGERKWTLDYSLDGKTWHKSKFHYDEEQVWGKMYEMYKFFRQKYDRKGKTD